METPDRKVNPFLSLRTPRTGAYLGEQVRMNVKTGSTGDDDNISEMLQPPRPADAPTHSLPKQENDELAMEEQLRNLI